MPMQEKMQEMQAAMAAIKAEQDPAKRQALMTQHMELMHKNMQKMMDQMMQHHGEESAQPAHQRE